MKPKTPEAMRRLIAQARAVLPFERSAEELCSDGCTVCSLKLLEYLAAEMEEWESRLDRGETPTLGDLEKLAKSARKIHGALVKGGVIADSEP